MQTKVHIAANNGLYLVRNARGVYYDAPQMCGYVDINIENSIETLTNVVAKDYFENHVKKEGRTVERVLISKDGRKTIHQTHSA